MSHTARQRLAATAAGAATLVLGVAIPAQAAPFTGVAWSVSQPQPTSTGVRYTWSFTTVDPGTIAAVTFTVPAGTGGAAAVADVYGLGGGTVSLNTGTNTITYTVTSPVPVAAGTGILISIGGLTNTGAPGTYASAVTTLTAGATTIDSGTSNSVALNESTTAVTVVVARSTSFTSDTTGFSMVMDPSVGSLADQTRPVTLTVATNAAGGYSLNTKVDRQLTGFANPTKTFAAVSSGIGSAVNTGAFAANSFGYTVTGGGGGTVGTAQGQAGSGYVGYTTGNEAPFRATGPTNGDTIVITNRAKINHLQSADRYSATITYTVTPNY